jgi:glutamyl-tRNA reductase
MAFYILGMNHKTAPVALREKVAFGEDRLSGALKSLRQGGGISEVVILSTCNRTEVYWSGTATGAELTAWLERHHGNSLDLASSLYVHQEGSAVEHAFSVASGLDSMVLGEPQILGQLKDAYRVAQESGSTGPTLNRLFQAAFAAAKRVRTETRIGANAVSLASATVSLARKVFADLSEHSALLIGAGEMNTLTAKHLSAAGLKRLVIANRTLSRAQQLATEISGYAVDLKDLDKALEDADIVVSCTASPAPIITRRAAEAAIRARRHRPIFMVDMAVPRDIESEVAELEDIYLFSIDDLQQLINENLQQRQVAAADAREVIAAEVKRFLADSRAQDAGPAIRALRQQAEGIRQQTLEQARRLLLSGKSGDEALEYLANTLTNRLLHSPTQALRQAAELSDTELAETLARLLTEDRDRQ